MDIYYYCSYTGSPVGFILGKLDGVNDAEDSIALSKDGLEPLIRRCFEAGMIRKACGILTREPKRYFLLLKKLVTRGSGDDLDYYLNIAFVTESREQYLQWMDGDETATESTIAQAVRETILVDRGSDFGYQVSGRPLAALTGKKFGSLLGKCRRDALKSDLCFELASHNADPDEVMRTLGIGDDTWTLEKLMEGESWVRLSKKKEKPSSNIIWAILLAVLAAAVFLWSRNP